jgi:aspartate dehydrogenase
MTAVALIGYGGIAQDVVTALPEIGSPVKVVGAMCRPGRVQQAAKALGDIPIVEACDGGSRILLPAGAVGGIDAIAAMRVGGLHMVRYRSRKPPAAWCGSPAEKAVDLDKLPGRTVLYRGSAGEAALLYPQNANVAAAVALAGLGFDATEVELVADPEAPGNVHEIEAEGVAGRFAIQLQDKASKTNPKTSTLAALSVARALNNLQSSIVI